jgi:DNA-directed RNA polymerase I subunit RPA49
VFPPVLAFLHGDIFFRPQITTEKQTTLLAHIFALCLRVDDYATDTTVIAKDLRMQTAKSVPSFLPSLTPPKYFHMCRVNALFKSLGAFIAQQIHAPRLIPSFILTGCKIETLSDKDLKRLGLPSSAADTKRAVLRVPVEFPKPRFGKKTRQ